MTPDGCDGVGLLAPVKSIENGKGWECCAYITESEKPALGYHVTNSSVMTCYNPACDVPRSGPVSFSGFAVA